MFFQSWQLWEKMSFILGISLLMVFTLGWAKLAFRIRLMKKQEIIDEEKRARLQELRATVQRGDSRGKHEIPFGIRALQSGIQVDGIWISNPNTPVPSEITLSSMPGESSDDLAKTSPKPISKAPPPPRPKPSVRVRSPGRLDAMGSYRSKSDSLPGIVEGKTTRISYKPRRSSHLRYVGQRDIHEDVLEHNEGAPVPLTRKKPLSLRTRSCLSTDQDPDSSAADNERNSGTSDESDATLSQEPQLGGDLSDIRYLSVAINEKTQKILPRDSSTLSEQTLQDTSDISNDKVLPEIDTFDDIAPYFLQSDREDYKNVDSTMTGVGPPRTHSPSIFKPGELHMNKTSRKVNTGFEVLPAGTFGLPVECNTDFLEPNTKEDSIDRRHPAKLQKKPPDSLWEHNSIEKV